MKLITASNGEPYGVPGPVLFAPVEGEEGGLGLGLPSVLVKDNKDILEAFGEAGAEWPFIDDCEGMRGNDGDVEDSTHDLRLGVGF